MLVKRMHRRERRIILTYRMHICRDNTDQPGRVGGRHYAYGVYRGRKPFGVQHQREMTNAPLSLDLVHRVLAESLVNLGKRSPCWSGRRNYQQTLSRKDQALWFYPGACAPQGLLSQQPLLLKPAASIIRIQLLKRV